MKRLFKNMAIFWGLLIVLFVIVSFCQAQEVKKDFDFSIKGVYTIYQDRDLQKDGTGLKGELRWKYVYLWGSWESTEMRLTGQRAGNVNLYGVGVGGKATILGPLSAFVEVGYYIPDSDMQKSPMTYAEGISFKWYETLNEIGLPQYAPIFTDYKYELKSGLGGSLGLSLDQEIYKGLHVTAFGSYRFLNLQESWNAYNPNYASHPGQGLYIQTKEKRSFSGGQFGIGLTYRF